MCHFVCGRGVSVCVSVCLCVSVVMIPLNAVKMKWENVVENGVESGQWCLSS